MKKLVWSLLTVAGVAWSQSPLPEEPPADSQQIAGEALRTRVSGKTFKFAAPGTPVTSRLQYNANGYVFLNVSTGMSDSAAWRIEGSQLCADWRKIPASCSEMRVKGDLLFAKRANGTWATLTPD
jgi:hypothetical protein